jgi:phenylalanyl-tRNA synthetase beta chain
MKIPMRWLSEWVESPWAARELGSRLTMAGFELEAVDESRPDDVLLELNVTPNRGDAMSVAGIAREVAALSGNPLKGPPIAPVPARHPDTLPVRLDVPAACPRFAGRIIRSVNNRAPVPAWMQERLQRAGVRSISPVVDVTNYVLLELGQPMHAYDLARLQGEIHVRHASAGEQLTLLDDRAITAGADVLLIADDAGGVGAAGIMGGARTAVSETTTDVFLEVAYFSPDAVLGRARRFGIQTDASQRYERGVDPAGQMRAMERATALILSIAGGSPGPIQMEESVQHVPQRSAVRLRRSQLQRLLGTTIEPSRVTQTLSALGMRVEGTSEGWRVTPPSHRFDVTIEADLIEEVARLIGYGAIPETHAPARQELHALAGSVPSERSVLDTLVARGYHEAITLAFVDPASQARLFPDREGQALSNPIASDLAVMRVSLWPGLLRAALENQRRQQERVRLFERGVRFGESEVDTLAGIATGPRFPEQWGVGGESKSPADFFDVKADVEALLAGSGASDVFAFEPGAIACLHPGRAAVLKRSGREVGRIGELHPALVRELGFTYVPVLFELDYSALEVARPAYREFSRFPSVRRDIAVVLDEAVPLSALRERVLLAAPRLLEACIPFDVYRGPGVETGRKSVALGLIFQDISRTLTDDDVDGAVAAILAALRASLNAKIRE